MTGVAAGRPLVPPGAVARERTGWRRFVQVRTLLGMLRIVLQAWTWIAWLPSGCLRASCDSVGVSTISRSRRSSPVGSCSAMGRASVFAVALIDVCFEPPISGSTLGGNGANLTGPRQSATRGTVVVAGARP